MSQSWEETVVALQAQMDEKFKAREEGLKLSRQLIQLCSKCIKHVHRRQFDLATGLLAEAKAVADKARSSLSAHPELYYAGYLQDAEKELVEAATLLNWVQSSSEGDFVPSQSSLAVGNAAYLNGLGEAASECRRYVLDELRKGDLATAELLLNSIEAVYDDLISFDYPDAMTGGLRRTCDALRAVIERTRADLTMTRVQHDLMIELRKSQEAQSS